MSYDLAVWEGERPADDVRAAIAFTALVATHLDTGVLKPPTERIEKYVRALLERWPDVTPDDPDTSPWVAGDIMSGAVGPIAYLGYAPGRAPEVTPVAAELAAAHGLVCFDPQEQRVL